MFSRKKVGKDGNHGKIKAVFEQMGAGVYDAADDG